MKKQLNQAERASLRLKILRTAKNNLELEKILLERMKQKQKQNIKLLE